MSYLLRLLSVSDPVSCSCLAFRPRAFTLVSASEFVDSSPCLIGCRSLELEVLGRLGKIDFGGMHAKWDSGVVDGVPEPRESCH